MTFFKYREFLEKENEYLKKKIELLEERNHELVKAFLPKSPAVTEIKAQIPTVKHSIVENEDQARCSCGWTFHSSDPGELQTEISSHYRSTSVKGGRKSWPQVKSMVESAAQMETT